MGVWRRSACAVLAVSTVAGTLRAAPPPLPPPPTTQPSPLAIPFRPGRHDPVLPPPLPAPASHPAPSTVPTAPAPQAAAAPATAPVGPAPPPMPATQPAPVAAVTPPVPIPDAVAYWAGLAAGRRVRERLAEDGSGYDNLIVLKGFMDGLSDHDPAFPRADAQAAFDQVVANVLQRRAEKRAADDPAFRRLADDNRQRSAALLAEEATRFGVRLLPDGVLVQTLRDGTGRPVASARAITAHLSVSLADGTLVVATDPARPAHLVLADVLPSLAEVIRGMRVNDRWRIVLPADKAYGLAGSPPLIGPNQALAFEVEPVEAE